MSQGAGWEGVQLTAGKHCTSKLKSLFFVPGLDVQVTWDSLQAWQFSEPLQCKNNTKPCLQGIPATVLTTAREGKEDTL